jgi:protein-S-isoprenylcysteine O-methyltransferase Ste14
MREWWRRYGALVKNSALALFWTWIIGAPLPQAMLLSQFWWPVWKVGAWRYVALLPLIFGAVMAYDSVWRFVTIGQGTPAPFDPPKRLVICGFYRYVRNPIYVGVLLIAVSELVLLNTASLPFLVAIAAVLFIVHLMVVLYEEPVLRRKFGSEYEDYLRSVPRWLPKLRSL